MALSYSANFLAVAIQGTTGAQATVDVYCGSKGNPKVVDGEILSSVYDGTSKTLRVNVLFASDIQLTLKWEESPFNFDYRLAIPWIIPWIVLIAAVSFIIYEKRRKRR